MAEGAMHNRWPALATGMAWAATLWWIPRPVERPVAPPARSGASEPASQFRSPLTDASLGMLGFHLFETKEGRPYWNLKSRFAELQRQSNYAFMQSIEGQFFSQSGNVVTTTGDSGRSELEERWVELEGNVAIRSRQGYLFQLERVTYQGKRHEFHSDAWVTMRGPDIEAPDLFLKGEGLLARIDEERYLLRHNVSGRKRLASLEWLDIRSRSGEFFSATNRAVFRGKVRSEMPQMLIESEEFEFESAPKGERILARGNVRVKARSRTGHAESALIDVGSNRLVLSGRASVHDQGNRLEGERIVLYTDEDRVEVIGARGNIEDGAERP